MIVRGPQRINIIIQLYDMDIEVMEVFTTQTSNIIEFKIQTVLRDIQRNNVPPAT